MTCVIFENRKDTNTTVHMLLNFPHTVNFGKSFHFWWLQNTGDYLNLSEVTLLYGFVQPSKHQQLLSLALLTAKYFIYKM